jgi:hypothetical protein
MLDFMKTILEKVSFDRHLFERELKKAIAILKIDELIEFKSWCYAKFSEKYKRILQRNFSKLAIN